MNFLSPTSHEVPLSMCHRLHGGHTITAEDREVCNVKLHPFPWKAFYQSGLAKRMEMIHFFRWICKRLAAVPVAHVGALRSAATDGRRRHGRLAADIRRYRRREPESRQIGVDMHVRRIWRQWWHHSTASLRPVNDIPVRRVFRSASLSALLAVRQVIKLIRKCELRYDTLCMGD